MKQHKFSIVFKCGVHKDVHCFSFKEAIILGAAWAIGEGIDTRMRNITGHLGEGTVVALDIQCEVGYEEVGDPVLTHGL